MSNKVMLTFTATVALAASCFAQQNAPVQPAAAKDAPAAAQSQKPSYETSTVLKVKSRLVVVDVVARDAKGVPVTDLKQEDFTVLEDGKEQKLRIFNFQQPNFQQPQNSVAAVAAQTPANAMNVVDNLPHIQAGRALNVVLLDSLNTSRLNQLSMREAMIKFLETLPANEPIAVYLLSDRLRLLQDFTTDPAVLKDVVRSFKGKSSPLLTMSTDGSPIAPVLPGVAQSLPPQMAAQIKEFQDQMTVDATDQRVQATLAALNSLSRTLSGYPGRKNLIWLSETFPFDVMLTSISGRASLNSRNYSPEIARTGNMLSDSQVAIYPLDARGLAGSGIFNVANEINQNGATLRGSMGSQMDRESDDRMAAHGTMNDLAERTGGRAFYNRNDLDGAVRDSITDGSTYYTLGYYPENKDWNGGFRNIQVKLKRGGVKLRYRIGYFAVDTAAFAKLSPKRQDEEFDDALSLNVPVSTALPFQALVMPPSAKTQNKVIVNYHVDPHALSFESSNDGIQSVNMECAVRVFPKKNPDKPIATEAQKMGGALNPEAYAKVMQGFFPCRDQLALQPGDYLLRLGVRDNVTGLIGTANASLTIPAESSSSPSMSTPPTKP